MLCWITILGGVLIMMGQHSRFSHTHLHALGREIVVELLRFLAVLQSPLSAFASFGIHKSNLLETRMVVTTYNHHLRLPTLTFGVLYCFFVISHDRRKILRCNVTRNPVRYGSC